MTINQPTPDMNLRTMLEISMVLVLFATLLPAVMGEQFHIVAIGTVLPQDTPVYHWCQQDPMNTVSIIPTRLGGSSVQPREAKRLIRLYFPRQLGPDTVDAIMFSAGDVYHFTTSQINSMTEGVENGIGALADCGGTSAISSFVDTWVASGIGRIFPNDISSVISGSYSYRTGSFPGYFLEGVPYTINVNDDVDDNPFLPFVRVGIEDVHGYAGRKMVRKSGSTVMATMNGNYGFLREDPPFCLEWEYDQGRTITVSEWFGHPFWGDYGTDIHMSDNPYGRDIFLNILLRLTDRPIFRDVARMHELHEKYEEYRVMRSTLISAIEFVSNFGANLEAVDEKLVSIDEGKYDADDYYLEGDYPKSLAAIEGSVDELSETIDLTLNLKDRALLNVYIIEWSVVTGALSITGIFLNFLMVKRKAYREVITTSTSRK